MEAAGHGTISRIDMTVFAIKSSLLKLRRVATDLLDGSARRLPRSATTGEMVTEVITPLFTENDAYEYGLQLGKVQNLRVGAAALDGTRIRSGQTFSFWAQVGPPVRARGFVVGRELRQGCLIPTVAGGLCQLSNSLHAVARRAGCAIVERHNHSAEVPGSPFSAEEDATVYWNYVDLRFRPDRDLRLCVRLDATRLIVRLEALA